MATDKTPTTAKEALIAELLQDLGVAIDKTNEAVIAASKVESELNASAKALIVAGEKYKGVVNSFTEQAKNDLTGHINEKMGISLSPFIEQLRNENTQLVETALTRHQSKLKRYVYFNTFVGCINLLIVGAALVILL